MASLKRVFQLALVFILAAPTGNALGAQQEEPAQDVPVFVTAFDQAAFEAINTTQEASSDWRSIAEATGLAPPSGVRIVGVQAVPFAFDDQGLFDASRMEVLRGPQGVLFGRPSTEVRNEPSPPFYEAQPVATAVMVETEGWPPETVDELFELALAFNWTGDEVLEESPFSADPLLGLGNVSSDVWFGEEQISTYAKVQAKIWTPFADPLLSFRTTTADDRHFAGWLLPGIPEKLQVTLSYSFDQTLDSMIAQQVEIPLPTEIRRYSFKADYEALKETVEAIYGGVTVQGTETPPQEPPAQEPGAENEADATPAPEQTGEIDESAQQEAPVVADPAPASETAQQDTQPDDESSSTLLLILFLLLIGLPAVAFLVWRFIRGRTGGGMVATQPPQHTSGPATAPPSSMPRPLMAGEKDEQALLDGTGPDPSQYKVSEAPAPTPPAVSSHPNPPERLMSDRDEALGVAEVLDGTATPDGWHRLPWETGAQFSILEDGKTYRTIPVRDVDLQSDVSFLGEPPGFEPDIERFAYWLHEDGTLKIGSPTDPHDASGSSLNVEGLDADLGEGESRSLEEVFDGIEDEPSSLEGVIDQIMLEDDHAPPPLPEQLHMAHRLSSDVEPVDGWLPLVQEALSIVRVDTEFATPDPDAWSGLFLNVDEQELVWPDDPRYDELCERFGVRPPPPAPEATIPLGTDDTPGIN